jgi:hypothetical protein
LVTNQPLTGAQVLIKEVNLVGLTDTQGTVVFENLLTVLMATFSIEGYDSINQSLQFHTLKSLLPIF